MFKVLCDLSVYLQTCCDSTSNWDMVGSFHILSLHYSVMTLSFYAVRFTEIVFKQAGNGLNRLRISSISIRINLWLNKQRLVKIVFE